MTTVLQFSGGKNSLALLYLLEPRWHEITVAWVNAGFAFPETLAQMDQVRAMVPNFMEIPGVQSIEHEGYPTDVLPISSTALGQQFERPRPQRFQSRYSCCATALWIPMQKRMKEISAQVIIRGQKRADDRAPRIPHGTVIDGVRYDFPLDDWTDEKVKDFLASRGVALPASYRSINRGLECWNCTAYLDQKGDRLDYMREHHPQKHDHVRRVLTELEEVVARDLASLRVITTKPPAVAPTVKVGRMRKLKLLAAAALASVIPGIA